MTHYSKVKRYTLGLFAAIALLTTPACNDDLGMESKLPSNEPALRICLTIDGDNLSRAGSLEDDGTMPGEGQTANGNFHENSVHSLDLFFYRNIAEVTDDAPSLLHIHTTNIDVTGNIVHTLVSLRSLQDLIDNAESVFRIVAVANCKEANKDDMSRNALRALVTKADATYSNDESRAFRGATAPNDFVMHNLNQTVTVRVEDKEYDDEVTDATVSLRRVAAKIRVGLDIIDEYEDSYGTTWVPDIDEARVYFTNGVRTARLDGDFDALCSLNNPPSLNDTGDDYTNSDYYSIATSGSKATEDYTYARPLLDFAGNMETIVGDSRVNNFSAYHYVNALPLYTYPTKWEDSSFELHQPTIVVVLPWEVKDADPGVDDEESTYKVCYYSMPVNNDGSIVSNAYYFTRAHIAMMGGESPQQPLQIDVECEMSEWGTARDTEADIRPLRYLQFNQTEFVVNNENSITIPFYSSHNVVDTKFECTYKLYNYYSGSPQERWFDQSVSVSNGRRDDLYKITIDNKNKTLTFTHNLFGTWSTSPALTTRNSSRTKTTSFTKGGNSESTTSRKLYTQFFVTITVRHEDKQNETNTVYEETLHITLNPAIYVYTEDVNSYAYVPGESSRKGGILLNGYGSSNGDTGELGGFTGDSGNNGDSNCLYFIVITQLNEDDAANWILDDPRTNYINNKMDNNSMNEDLSDELSTWTDNGGPYPGYKTNTQKGNGLWRTIWEDYDGPEWNVAWGENQIWNPTNDTHTDRGSQGLRYYYPAAESNDKRKVIGPSLIFVSHHATNRGTTTKQEARRRCATYQQAGYPAGRWRLPTEAEMAFMKKMKMKDVTTDIFGGVNYWTSHGKMDGNNSDYTAGSSTGDAWARCVYDAWYWDLVDAEGNRSDDRIKSKDNWGIFTYGDRPRESYLNVNTNSEKEEQYTVERFLEMQKGIKAVK